MDFVLLVVPFLLLSFGSDALAATVASPPTPPMAMTAPPPTPVTPAQTPDWAKIQELRAKEIGSYATLDEDGASKLNADMNEFLIQAERFKIVDDAPGFRTWWEKNRASVLESKTMADLKRSSVSEFTMTMYFDYKKSVAAKMDAASPGKKKGSQYLNEYADYVLDNPVVTATVVGTGWVVKQFWKILFYGPGVRMGNTSLSFAVDPVINQTEKLVNQNVAPRFVWWKRLVSGDWLRVKKALKQSASGEELTGDARRFLHPALKVEDFTAVHGAFYDRMTEANDRLKGFEGADAISARATGFDQLFRQFSGLSTELSGHQVAYSAAEQDLDRYSNKLIAKGAKEADIERFTALIREYQNLVTYENPQHPQIAELHAKIRAISQGWIENLKIPKGLVDQIWNSQVQSVNARNRKAFALTSYLASEMFYREYNVGVAKIPELLQWHEFARNNAGLYHDLEQERENITKMFEKLEIPFDVQARIDERGFALGGPARPKNVLPLNHPLRDVLPVGEVKSVGEVVQMPSVHEMPAAANMATPECAEKFGRVYQFTRRAARSLH